VMQMGLVAHRALGCRGLTRSDFRYDGKDFYILEINTQPGMTSLSLSPEIAAYVGISFNELVQELVAAARVG
ncbi:MAG: D-alanine--D-alanine ligase, partial [Rickettsiales bacterium]